MRYRKLTEDGDMNFGNQQQDFFINSTQNIQQSVLTRLKLWSGEWYLDTSDGTRYQQSALGTNKKQTIGAEIRDRILSTEGVTELVEFNVIINADDRTATVKATIDTVYGQTEILGVL